MPIFFSFKSKWCKSKGSSVKVSEMFPSRVQIEKTPTALMEGKVNKITSFTMLFQFFLSRWVRFPGCLPILELQPIYNFEQASFYYR